MTGFTAGDVRAGLVEHILHDALFDQVQSLAGDEALVSGGLIDSFHLIRLAVFVEDRYGVHIPDDDLTAEQLDTLDQMTAYIVGKLV